MKQRIYQFTAMALIMAGALLFFSSIHILAPPVDLLAPRDPLSNYDLLRLFGGVGCIAIAVLMAVYKNEK